MIQFPVADVFRVDGLGVVIAGSSRDLDDLEKAELVALVGPTVSITRPDGSVRTYSVLDVKYSVSLVDRKNVFLVLSPEIAEADVPLGSMVCIPHGEGSRADEVPGSS